MKINCGPDWEEKQEIKEQKFNEYRKIEEQWTPFFAWTPLRIRSRECRWLETIYRKRKWLEPYYDSDNNYHRGFWGRYQYMTKEKFNAIKS